MDPEQEQPQPELELQPPEQELQGQLVKAAVYTAKAIRLGIAALTSGLSKVGEFLWGLIANWVVGGITIGDLHGHAPLAAKRQQSFFQRHKTSLLLLALVVGAILLPLLFIFMNLFATMSGFRSEPPAPISQ